MSLSGISIKCRPFKKSYIVSYGRRFVSINNPLSSSSICVKKSSNFSKAFWSNIFYYYLSSSYISLSYRRFIYLLELLTRINIAEDLPCLNSGNGSSIYLVEISSYVYCIWNNKCNFSISWSTCSCLSIITWGNKNF